MSLSESKPSVVIAGVAHPDAARRALRAVAAFEFLKGLAALAGVIGIIDLMHHDARRIAIGLIGHFGLNADSRYPSLLLHYADQLPGANVNMLAMLAAGYISVRWMEALGLWNDQAWGEWLGALSGGIYIPFEFIHLEHVPTMINAGVLLFNVAMVAFLAWRLWRRRNPGTT